MSIAASDLVEGLLPAPSWIRTNRIVTLNDHLVVKRIGRLSNEALTEAIARLCQYLKDPASTAP